MRQEKWNLKRVFIYVNGIMTMPGDTRDWNWWAVTWTHLNTGDRAEKLLYWVGPIGRVFGQRRRAATLYDMCNKYAPFYDEIVLVGHSNGADVIVDALRTYRDFPKVKRIHLVSGATEGDFVKNGLNGVMSAGKLGGVTVYCSGRDMALAAAHTWAGKLLGYGTIGLSGPVNVSAANAARVRRVDWPEYGHSGCWAGANFDVTMRLLTTGVD